MPYLIQILTILGQIKCYLSQINTNWTTKLHRTLQKLTLHNFLAIVQTLEQHILLENQGTFCGFLKKLSLLHYSKLQKPQLSSSF